MKAKFIYTIFLLSIAFCLESDDITLTNTIYFTNKEIRTEGNAIVNGTWVIIEKPGVYLVHGESNEGKIKIKSSSVDLYLLDLMLSSKETAPIIINSNLKDVKIINIRNTILNDLEEPETTKGECAVIKIKKNSIVTFENRGIFNLNGKCKNIIKGGSQTSIIFEKTENEGKYIINANKTGISSDGYLEFNGGTFTITSDYGDAIKSEPVDEDTESLGKILINDGYFIIHSFNDAFTAKNNITILKGKFDIQTENGFDSETYDENESSKGFKLTSDEPGAEIKIYSGDFKLNVADDAFRSNRDITLIAGTFEISTKDDGICAKYDLTIGEKDAPKNKLKINVINSYEAIEGMTVTIYSATIKAHAKDDGINASGVIKKQRSGRNHSSRNRNNSSTNDTNLNNNTHHRNHSTGFDPLNRRNHTGAAPNDSYRISIYDGDIYIYTDSDGIDCNGNLYIHGGNINIFSEGSGANEPIDHNGNFTLFGAEILGVGTGGLEFVHEGIKRGDQKYAFYYGYITKDKRLEIVDGNNDLVKEGYITKDINYIFYTSSKLNENYHFYIYENEIYNKTKLNITFGDPENGEDDEDYGEEKSDNNEDKTEDKNTVIDNNSKKLKSSLLSFIIILIILF